MRSDFDPENYSRILKRFVKTLVSADRFIVVQLVLLLVKKRFSGDNDSVGVLMKITVSAYSGYKANERPCRFELESHAYEVEEVLDRWYGPDSLYFKVRADDQNLYILRYASSSEEWSLESFRQGSVH